MRTRAAARRRAALLLVAIALPTAAVLAGATAAWPLFALPLAVSYPLAGPRGAAAAAAVAGLIVTLASGRPGAEGAEMAVGLAAFAATGLVVAVGHLARSRDVRRVEALSFTDRLTGLHNYAFFEDALRRECRRADRYGRPLSLVLLDIDRFKEFNDRHGHDAGNRLLAAVGEAFRACARGSDVAARFGGEEFALLVPGPGPEALRAAERIRAAVARARVPVAGGPPAGATISAGVAELVPGADDGGALLLEQADRALYHSKAGGRDRASLFSPERRWTATAS